MGTENISLREYSSASNNLNKGLVDGATARLEKNSEYLKTQETLSEAGADFAQASLVSQTAHSTIAKLIGLTKTVVQGYLGVA